MFGGMAAFGLVGCFLGPIVLYMTREFLATQAGRRLDGTSAIRVARRGNTCQLVSR